MLSVGAQGYHHIEVQGVKAQFTYFLQRGMGHVSRILHRGRGRSVKCVVHLQTATRRELGVSRAPTAIDRTYFLQGRIGWISANPYGQWCGSTVALHLL